MTNGRFLPQEDSEGDDFNPEGLDDEDEELEDDEEEAEAEAAAAARGQKRKHPDEGGDTGDN